MAGREIHHLEATADDDGIIMNNLPTITLTGKQWDRVYSALENSLTSCSLSHRKDIGKALDVLHLAWKKADAVLYGNVKSTKALLPAKQK